jgi:hypothetical protein
MVGTGISIVCRKMDTKIFDRFHYSEGCQIYEKLRLAPPVKYLLPSDLVKDWGEGRRIGSDPAAEQGQTIPRASLNTKLPSLVLVIQKLTTTSPKGQMSTISIPPIFTTPKHPPSSTLLYPQHFGLIWRPFARSSSRPADRK